MGESTLSFCGVLVGSGSNPVLDDDDVAILNLLFDDEDEMEMKEWSMCQEVEKYRSIRRERMRPTDETTIDSDDQVLRLEQSVAQLEQEKGHLAAQLKSATDILNVLAWKRKERIRQLTDGLNRNGAMEAKELVKSCCCENVKMVNPCLQMELEGHHAMEEYLGKVFQSFPDAMFDIESMKMVDKGGQQMLVHFSFTGTHVEPLGGVPAYNRELELEGKANIQFQGTSLNIQSMAWIWNPSVVISSLMGIDPALHFLQPKSGRKTRV